MNTVDGLIGILLLLGAWQGFRRGFVASLYAFAALVAQFVVAGWLRDPLAAFLGQFVPVPPETLATAAFLVAISLVGVALGLVGAVVIGIIRTIIYRLPFVKPLDKVLGVIPGILQYALLAAGLIVIMQLVVPATSSLGAELRASTLKPLVDFVGGFIAPARS